MKFRALLLFVVVTLTGCATPALRPEVSLDLQQSKLAGVFYLEKKTIEYNEMVYKVLWNENRKHVSDFNGLWDIDAEMTEQLAKDMAGLHLDAKPIRAILSEDASYNDLVKAIQGTRGPDNTNVPLQLGDSTLAKLRKAGIGYLLVVRAAGFNISTTTMNSSGALNLPSILFVYDIKQGKEEYRELMFSGEFVKWGKTPRNIESNDMSILKDASKKMLKVSVENHFPKVLGVTQIN